MISNFIYVVNNFIKLVSSLFQISAVPTSCIGVEGRFQMSVILVSSTVRGPDMAMVSVTTAPLARTPVKVMLEKPR